MRLFLVFLLAALLSIPFLLRGKERGEGAAIAIEAPVEQSMGAAQDESSLASSFSEISRKAVTTAAEGASASTVTPAIDVKPASLRGVLLDEKGEPITKSEVRLLDYGGDLMSEFKSAMTDIQGLFAFTNLPPKVYVVAIRAKGSESVTKLATVTLNSGQEEFQTLFVDGNRTLTGAFPFSKSREWNHDTDKNVVVLQLYRAYGPEEMVACGVATTSHDEPELSGSFKFTHLQPDLYRLKVVVSAEGAYLEFEVDLSSSDQKLEPVQIEPSTQLLAAR